MDKKQAIDLVEQTFPQPFEKEQFHQFVTELLHHLDDSPERSKPWAGQFIKKAYQDYVSQYERLGTYTDPEGRKLDVLVIHLKKDTTLERGRTRLRNFAADYLSTGHGNDKDAVLAAYVSPQEDDWRFSFVKLEYALEQDEAGMVKERKELTPARRYSFLVGANERSHTAQKQFLPLLVNDQSDPLLNDIEKAFGIEKVTKEFFERYKNLFEKTKAALDNLIKRDARVRAEFKDKSIETDDFAKKLLGQIVFLYFLQKKGWFGVERDAAWGTGNKNYLRYLFENREHLGSHQGRAKKQDAVNFFNDILEHLFYEALANERTNHYYGRFDCRIPFLNGGLFEPLQDYSWDSVDILLPDELFSNDELTKDGDIGTGILDVFDRYNFTVNEAEPLETEVAVDPEMLGKVFENLLPENLRYKGGTYYTPRVIVNYLCQQSIINYLASRLEGKVSRDDIEALIIRGEVLREFEANQRENEKNRLPEAVRKHAKGIDRLLAEITVCDPAIGSGAFPVGMMQEIVKARLTLTSVERMPDHTAYDLKRHAIENSLYGVDIDPGAIEIARLRLWLSLVVDEDDFKRIQPLPNLDYKIMQGNSLLEEFEGVKLIEDSVIMEAFQDNEARIAEFNKLINQLERDAIVVGSKEGKRSPAFLKLQNDLVQLKKQRDALYLQDDKAQSQMGLLDSSRKLGEKLSELEKLRQNYLDYHSISEKKNKLRSEIENKEWEIVEQILTNQGKRDALSELAKHRRDNRKNFFLWKFYFSQVFRGESGFDVVLANPPYVRQEEIKELKPALKRGYNAFTGTADLYVYFYERAVNLLNDAGVVAFITSNKYFRAGYGEKLRRLLAQNTRIHQVIDFGDAPVFEATAYASIIILQRKFDEASQPRVWSLPPNEPIDSFERRFNEYSFALPQAELKADGWRLESPKVLRLLEKLRSAGTPLGEYIEGRFYYGIKTGLNKAFVVDRQTRDRLIAEDKSSAEILKPFLRGRDVKRWRVEPQDIWLIFTRRGIDINRYPAIHKHLKQFKAQLIPGVPGGRKPGSYQWYEIQDNIAYWKEFEQQKILYQEIATFQAFSYDRSGSFANNKTFLIPTKDLALLGILNSKLAWWFLHQICSKLQGGALAMQTPYVSQLPIASAKPEQHRLLSSLTDYLVFISYKLVGLQPRDQLMISYFEQLIDALVYELYLPDEIHTAGKQFFAPLIAERLPALDEIKGDKLAALRQIFERLYDRNHVIRKNIFFLDTIESVRISKARLSGRRL